MCCIQYSPCSDTNSWAFDNKVDADTKIGTNCSQDYVEISGKTKYYLILPLCSRNFQNVKLRLDFVEIGSFYCHSDFM